MFCFFTLSNFGCSLQFLSSISFYTIAHVLEVFPIHSLNKYNFENNTCSLLIHVLQKHSLLNFCHKPSSNKEEFIERSSLSSIYNQLIKSERIWALLPPSSQPMVQQHSKMVVIWNSPTFIFEEAKEVRRQVLVLARVSSLRNLFGFVHITLLECAERKAV